MPTIETSDTFLMVRTANRREFREIELLLLSRAIPFTVEEARDVFFIPIHHEAFARAELRKYFRENRNWPPLPVSQKGLLFHFSPVHVVIVAALALFFWYLDRLPESEFWSERGMLAVERVLAGEWQRTVTALTLHVDTAHLVSNVLGLLVFVGGVHQFAGPGCSWLLVLLSGALGNYCNALFHGFGHAAVGASTAVFGAVGLAGAFGARRYLVQKTYRRQFFVPLVGALGLFAMLGTNPASDVMAHVFGLCCGVLIGLLTMPLLGGRVFSNPLIQVAAFLSVWLIVVLSWRVRLDLPLLADLI